MPRDCCTGYTSLYHYLFLYFLIKHEKVNLSKYMFNHMCWDIKENNGAKKRRLLEQRCFTSHLSSFDNNKVLKIFNWIC